MLNRLLLPLLLLLSVTWASPRYDIKATSRSRLTTRDVLHKKFLRIMPLGDSITFGYLSSDGNGYREHLFSQLVAENNDVDMVGSVQAGTMADNFNEGHPGWVITQIAGAAAASTGLEPNVVLLHAGTNDMNIPTDPTKAYERLGALIDQLNHGWPAAAILVAQIIPAANNSTMTNINAYNAQIPAVVTQRRDAGKHVLLVDMSTPRITLADLKDGLHPTDKGYAKTADLWHQGLETAASLGWLKSL